MRFGQKRILEWQVVMGTNVARVLEIKRGILEGSSAGVGSLDHLSAGGPVSQCSGWGSFED